MQKALFLALILFSKIGFTQITNLESKCSLRAVEIFNTNIAWAAGSKGSILKTIDGGKTWINTCPTTFINNDFRGLAVLNDSTVIAMSAGENNAFLLKTTNSGASWSKIFNETQKGVFFDCIKFADAQNGFLLSDPIDNKPLLYQTTDGGNRWSRVLKDAFPDILADEASFAASNSNIDIKGNSIFMATQNRVFKSSDLGKTWEILKTPFQKSKSEGIFGIKFMDENNGFLVGGDYLENPKAILQVVESNNGGKTWPIEVHNFAFGVTESIAKTKNEKLIKVSSNGIYVFRDLMFNQHWKKLDSTPFHAISCFENKCIAVGGNGKIGVFEF